MSKLFPAMVAAGALASVVLTAPVAHADSVTRGGFGCTNGTYVAWRVDANHYLTQTVSNGSVFKSRTSGTPTAGRRVETLYTSYTYSDQQTASNSGTIWSTSRLCHST